MIARILQTQIPPAMFIVSMFVVSVSTGFATQGNGPTEDDALACAEANKVWSELLEECFDTELEKNAAEHEYNEDMGLDELDSMICELEGGVWDAATETCMTTLDQIECSDQGGSWCEETYTCIFPGDLMCGEDPPDLDDDGIPIPEPDPNTDMDPEDETE